jgi:hypothetical protein
MRWLLALLALVLPPLALAGKGGAAARFGPPLLWVAALAVFFGLAWGPGLVLAALAGLLAAIMLLTRR